MTNKELIALEHAHLSQTYNRFELALEHGKGARCRSFDGREYIDFSSGIGVNSLGFCDQGWVQAVSAQASALQHASNLYYTEPCIRLAETLCRRTGMARAFFGNSGSEANEGAIKAARKYSFDKYGPGRSRILTLQNSFHGRTLAALSATGQEVFHRFFSPFVEGFDYLPAGDLPALQAELEKGDVCAVMLELIQGEGGVIPLEHRYVDAVAALCEQNDLLLIVDEVQTGVGRTGRLLCCEHYGVKPDIVTLAKGLGGGLPIGGILFSERCAGTLGLGDHASTFGGNPVCCAAANYVLSRLDDTLLCDVGLKGDYIRENLSRLPGVTGVFGLGLMLGVSLEEPLSSRSIAERCVQEGLMVLTAKARLRLLPPLTIGMNEIDEGLAILTKVIESECVK